jgi:glutamate-1-semialdehyde 2,1-aminomutase
MSTNYERQYRERTRESFALWEEASQVLPGGVAGNGKFMQPYPVYAENAEGAYVWDVDGNKYIDVLMGAGVHILGHSPKPVLDAVQAALPKGNHLYLPALPEVRMAQKVRQLMPHVEMVRFLNSGTEATLMAMRAARAYRKRDKIAKFEGNFHGQHDFTLVSTMATAGPDAVPEPALDSAGVPKRVTGDFLILPYNDPSNAVELIEEHADELAAVIMEPVSAFGLGCVPAKPEFLRTIREVTQNTGVLLIFDEIVTNFRLALGGATEYFGITPDLVTLGKILTAGYPGSGFGGRKDIMDSVVTPSSGIWDLKEQIFQSGSFSGNPISMTAGVAVLEQLEKKETYSHLKALADQMWAGFDELAKSTDQQMLVTGVGSMFQIHFGVDRLENKRDALKLDKAKEKEFHLGLVANGILASAHPLFLSAAHTAEDVDAMLSACEKVLGEMNS